MHGTNYNTIRHLRERFASRTSQYRGFDNRRGSKLYQAQVEFMYLMRQIETGSKYEATKAITDASQLLDNMQLT